MARIQDDQFHRDHSFREGQDTAGEDLSDEEIAARGLNPDPVGIAADAPRTNVPDMGNSTRPVSEGAPLYGKGRFGLGTGTSSAPSTAGHGTNSVRHVPQAQGIDLTKGEDETDPVLRSTRGEGSEVRLPPGEAPRLAP